jgi:hypothetical protein
VQECGHFSDQMLMVSQRRMLFLACEWILGWAKHTHSSAQATRLGGCHVGFASIRGSFPADFFCIELRQVGSKNTGRGGLRWDAATASHCGQARSSAFFNSPPVVPAHAGLAGGPSARQPPSDGRKLALQPDIRIGPGGRGTWNLPALAPAKLAQAACSS